MNDSVKSLVEVSTRTINGKEVLAVTSLQVAKHFEKEHKHVLRDIRIILEADEDGFSESNFGLSSYLTEQNKEMPMYVMSKDGFVLLVMGYTGPEAMRMKKAYIARFNEMEEQLRTTSPLLPNFRDPIAAAEAWIVASDVCDILEMGNPRSSLALLDEDEKGVHSMDTPGGKHKRNPRSLTGPGALRYQKVASSTDSVSAGASYLRKPQLTRRQYHVTVECQAF